jgi:acyl-CoA thioester hydrolase
MAMTAEPRFPDHCGSRFRTRVRFFETDLMGVVHHAAYLTYLEAARVEYLRRRGADYRRLVEGGLHMAVVEAALRYKKTATFDDELMVETRLSGLSRVTTTFEYRIVLASDPRTVIAEGHTRLACVDSSGRPRRIPEWIAEILTAAEDSAVPAGGSA